MRTDLYGSPLSTASDAAREAYVQGVERYLAGLDGVVEAFQAAIAADPRFAMARTFLARFHQTLGDMPAARAELAAARAVLGDVSPREAAQIDMIGDLLEGRGPAGYAKIRAHVLEHPRDILVAQTCTSVFGLIGFSGQPGREAEQLAYMTALKPHYGEDWWFLTQFAFAQLEAGQIGPAEANIDAALAARPGSAHSAHVRAHLDYETGRPAAGLAYLEDFWRGLSPAAYMHCHVSWHVALWALAAGETEKMWAVFDAAIAPDRAGGPPLNIQTDSVALLYRAALAGIEVPRARWQQLSDYSAARFPAPGLAFADVHSALSHAMAGETERLDLIVAGAKGPAGPVVRCISQAFGALADGAPGQAVAHLTQIMAAHERIGGSRAQRDLLEFALAHALALAGHPDEARRSLRMRRPHSARDHRVAALSV